MARLDKEAVGLKKEAIDVHQLIQDSIRHHTMTLHDMKGEVHCELKASLTNMEADKFHLLSVFNNLLDNAIKYCRTIPEITIRTLDHHKGLLIEIVDNGIGISQENQKRIFQKFYRVPFKDTANTESYALALNDAKPI